MQINSSNSFSPNFGALHVANAGRLNLYKICNSSDKKFLAKLAEETKMGELMPGLRKDLVERWSEMLRYASDNAQSSKNITYLETFNGKPCGIITFKSEQKISSLDCICTWPVETGKKVKLAGKTLFYQFFKDIQMLKNCKKVKLEAITNGPFDTVQKYEELGFKKTSKVFPTKVVMEINSQEFKKTYQNLTSLIDYNAIEPEKVNLWSIK